MIDALWQAVSCSKKAVSVMNRYLNFGSQLRENTRQVFIALVHELVRRREGNVADSKM